jgi:hypothetical protein
VDQVWFVLDRDGIAGPFTTDEVRRQMDSGLLARDAFVRANSNPGWSRASSIPEFTALHAQARPKPTTEPHGTEQQCGPAAARSSISLSVMARCGIGGGLAVLMTILVVLAIRVYDGTAHEPTAAELQSVEMRRSHEGVWVGLRLRNVSAVPISVDVAQTHFLDRKGTLYASTGWGAAERIACEAPGDIPKLVRRATKEGGLRADQILLLNPGECAFMAVEARRPPSSDAYWMADWMAAVLDVSGVPLAVTGNLEACDALRMREERTARDAARKREAALNARRSKLQAPLASITGAGVSEASSHQLCERVEAVQGQGGTEIRLFGEALFEPGDRIRVAKTNRNCPETEPRGPAVFMQEVGGSGFEVAVSSSPVAAWVDQQRWTDSAPEFGVDWAGPERSVTGTGRGGLITLDGSALHENDSAVRGSSQALYAVGQNPVQLIGWSDVALEVWDAGIRMAPRSGTAHWARVPNGLANQDHLRVARAAQLINDGRRAVAIPFAQMQSQVAALAPVPGRSREDVSRDFLAALLGSIVPKNDADSARIESVAFQAWNDWQAMHAEAPLQDPSPDDPHAWHDSPVVPELIEQMLGNGAHKLELLRGVRKRS